MTFPEWWEWELDFDAHVEERMEERDYSEVDLRTMLENATEVFPARGDGRWLALTKFRGGCVGCGGGAGRRAADSACDHGILFGLMKSISLQVTYRKGKASAAYLYLDHPAGTKSARTIEWAPGLIVDFAADGRPMGVEVLDPERVTIVELFAVFDGLGLARPDAADLAPLAAA
jgi:hypothetical protein